MAGSLLIKLFVLALIGVRDGLCSNDDDQTQTDGNELEIKINEPQRPPPPRYDSQTLKNETVVINSPVLPPPPKYESANVKTTRSETGNDADVHDDAENNPSPAGKILSTVAAVQQGQGQTQILTTVSNKNLQSDTQGRNNGTVERNTSPKLSTIVMANVSTTSTVKISTPSSVYISARAENSKSTTKNLESGSLPKDKETDATSDEEDSETSDDDADDADATDKEKAGQKPDTNDGAPSTVLLQSKFSTQRVTELASSTVLPSEPSEDEDDNLEAEEDEEDDDYGTDSDNNETLTGARDEDENEDNNENKGLNVGDDDDDDEEDPDQEVDENESDTSQKAENPEKSQVGKKTVVVEPQGSTHFMSYFLISVVFVACFYLVFHNRQKIKAYVLEGRNGRGGRRRKGGSDYQKLSTAEEVLPSLEKGIETKVTYNY